VRIARATSAIALTALAAAGVSAHEKKSVGPVVLTIGWSDEPPLTGVRNAVEVAVADTAGAPVVDPAASLTVQITFAGEQTTLPLVAEARQPGRYRAWLIPTRAGTYAFHVSGTIRHQPIDVTSTCSDKTFECVADAADLQFPARDPSPAQLAERVARSLPRADESTRRAAIAEWLAVGAILLAAASVAITLARARTTARSTPTSSV